MCIVCMKLLHGLLYLYNGFHKPKNRRICIPSQSGKGHTCLPPSHTTVMVNCLAIPSCKDQKHSQRKMLQSPFAATVKRRWKSSSFLNRHHYHHHQQHTNILFSPKRKSSAFNAHKPNCRIEHCLLVYSFCLCVCVCVCVCVGVYEELQKSLEKSE